MSLTMKREVLFRGASEYDGKMKYGFLSWADTPRGRAYFINNKIVKPESVSQYTGIIDKNGTKIFEGDIIMERYKGHERTYSVFWNNDWFAFRANTIDCSYALDDIMSYGVKVIGNIHDNKELLK